MMIARRKFFTTLAAALTVTTLAATPTFANDKLKKKEKQKAKPTKNKTM